LALNKWVNAQKLRLCRCRWLLPETHDGLEANNDYNNNTHLNDSKREGVRVSKLRVSSLALVLAVALLPAASAQSQMRFSDLPDAAQARISEAVAREAGLPQKWAKITLSGSDTKQNNRFGFAVATSGDTVVVVSRYFDCLQGGAYVFVKPLTGWQDMTQTAKLTGSDFGPCGGSGFDEVAIDGDTIIAGPGPSGATTYVFVKPEGGWKDSTETARLNTNPNLYGMLSLGISGDTVVVGYPNGLGNELGAAAVFVEPPSGWQDMTQTAVLSASDGASGDRLGWAVAIDGTRVIAGAPYAEVNGVIQAGAVYVFDQPSTGWADMTQTAKLISPDSMQITLGWCVGMSQGAAVAGATTAAYVFADPGEEWSAAEPPTGTLTMPQDSGPYSVSIGGDVVAIGTGGGYPTYYGAMFAWAEPLGGWQNASSPEFDFWGKPSGGPQLIGYSVATDGTILVAGAPGHKHDTGVVYLFAPK
jgi:hypothetical protein